MKKTVFITAAVVLLLCTSALAEWLSPLSVGYVRSILLGLPHVIYMCLGTISSSRIMKISLVLNACAYAAWLFSYVNSPGESMSDLAAVAAYMLITGTSTVIFLICGTAALIAKNKKTN